MRRLVLILVISLLAFAQSYRCDWQVVGIGGGEMAGVYRCGATAGQTVAGYMAGQLHQAFIGFWQSDVQTGIRDEELEPAIGSRLTRLGAVLPNPFTRMTRVCYTLGCEERVVVTVCDIAGRVVRRLVSGVQKPGRYVVNWDGRDESGRLSASGLYICQFSAGGYHRSAKLVLQR